MSRTPDSCTSRLKLAPQKIPRSSAGTSTKSSSSLPTQAQGALFGCPPTVSLCIKTQLKWTECHTVAESKVHWSLFVTGCYLHLHFKLPSYDLQAVRSDKVSTRQNGAGPGSNGASIGEGTALGGRSSNGSSPESVLQGTDLQEKPYSNNSNGASYKSNGSSYSKQGSAAQRREAAVADALEDAAVIDVESRQDAEEDPCASGHLGECAVSRSMDMEAQQAISQTSASVSQQQAAVQEATESPKAKKSGNTWSKVGKASTIQVPTSFDLACPSVHNSLLALKRHFRCPHALVYAVGQHIRISRYRCKLCLLVRMGMLSTPAESGILHTVPQMAQSSNICGTAL